jgi:hypothetical protein
MPRGIGAVVVIVSLILSMSVLGGVGFYALLGADVSAESQNQDVQNAADQLGSISFAEDRSNSILEGPLAVVTPVIGIFKTFITVIRNTSGVLQLLYGVGPVVGDAVELMFRMALLVTIGYAVRSGSGI